MIYTQSAYALCVLYINILKLNTDNIQLLYGGYGLAFQLCALDTSTLGTSLSGMSTSCTSTLDLSSGQCSLSLLLSINSRPSGQGFSDIFSRGSKKIGRICRLAEAERDNISRLMKITDIIRA